MLYSYMVSCGIILVLIFIYSGHDIGVFNLFSVSTVMNFAFTRDSTMLKRILIVVISAVFVETSSEYSILSPPTVMWH